MSYFPGKKMWRDENGVNRFLAPGTAKGLPTKRWYRGEVTRVAKNGKGDAKRDRQWTTVFAHEDEVILLVLRRCPVPLGMDGDVSTNVFYRETDGGELL